MPEMKPVFSSVADAVGYDPLLQELHVQWKAGNGVSVYYGVPPEVGGDLHNQPSIGAVLNHIKANYRHAYA